MRSSDDPEYIPALHICCCQRSASGLSFASSHASMVSPWQLPTEGSLETVPSLWNMPLSAFTTAARPVRLNVQLDATRRRIRQFTVCVVKNPQQLKAARLAIMLLTAPVSSRHPYDRQPQRG
eukprot:6211009-Pleurochrysis_carterae.AAC.1